MADEQVMEQLKSVLMTLPDEGELDAETIVRVGHGLAWRVLETTEEIARMHQDEPLKGGESTFVALVLAVLAGHVKEHGAEWLTDV